MKFMAYFSAEGSKIWGKAGRVPASKAVMESEEYLSLPYRDEFVKAQKRLSLRRRLIIIMQLIQSLQNSSSQSFLAIHPLRMDWPLLKQRLMI